jgi:hypothetical protein
VFQLARQSCGTVIEAPSTTFVMVQTRCIALFNKVNRDGCKAKAGAIRKRIALAPTSMNMNATNAN